MTDKKRYKYMTFAFIILSALILIGHYYFFVHKTLVLEEISPGGDYKVKCYAGPEYNQAIITFEANIGTKSIELSIANDRRPIKASNFNINWKKSGALVVVSSDRPERNPIEVEFKVSGDSILTDVNWF